MTAWIAALSFRHYQMLTDLLRVRPHLTPDELALHLLEREHGRVFGQRTHAAETPGDNDDADEVTEPSGGFARAVRPH